MEGRLHFALSGHKSQDETQRQKLWEDSLCFLIWKNCLPQKVVSPHYWRQSKSRTTAYQRCCKSAFPQLAGKFDQKIPRFLTTVTIHPNFNHGKIVKTNACCVFTMWHCDRHCKCIIQLNRHYFGREVQRSSLPFHRKGNYSLNSRSWETQQPLTIRLHCFKDTMYLTQVPLVTPVELDIPSLLHILFQPGSSV